MQTIIFSCSERQDNLTIRASQAIAEYFPGCEIIDLREFHLNIFGTADAQTQNNFALLAEKFQSAQQIIFVSPEYNWSLSPNAKNLIDYLSGKPEIWSDKVFMCFGCSAGRGGRLPIIELWTILNKIIAFSNAISFISPYHIEITGSIIDQSNRFIESFKPISDAVFANHHHLVSKCLLGSK